MADLKKIYIVYDDEEGEIEGMFTEQGDLLDGWCCNDAHWRDEYLNGFMMKLGFDVIRSDDEKLKKKLREALNG